MVQFGAVVSFKTPEAAARVCEIMGKKYGDSALMGNVIMTEAHARIAAAASEAEGKMGLDQYSFSVHA